MGGAWTIAAPAHAAADFNVTVTLRPPAGCSATVGPTGPGGTPQVTLTCGSNLYINVQPTVLTSPAGPPPTGTAGPSFTNGASDTRPPSEATQNIASLMNLDDTRTSVGGALFVQRRTATGDVGGFTTASSSQVLPDASPNNPNTLSGQPVEMWLIF